MRAGRDVTGALLGLCFAQLERTAHAMHAHKTDDRVKRAMMVLTTTKTILLECVFSVCEALATYIDDAVMFIVLHFFLDKEWKPLYKGDTSAC
jgi:hypothetical protein